MPYWQEGQMDEPMLDQQADTRLTVHRLPTIRRAVKLE